MKVLINNQEYKMKIIPREFTAVLISKDEPMKDDDNAFIIFNCPLPTDKKDLKVLKEKAIAKAEKEEEALSRYLQCNKTLHEGDSKK